MNYHNTQKHVSFDGKMIILGFGSIAQGSITLLLRHIAMKPEQITIFTADENGREIAATCGVADFRVEPITRYNYIEKLSPLLKKGDIVINLACNVSTLAMIVFCQERGILYTDTDLWPWVDNDYVLEAEGEERFNYLMREKALQLRSSASPGSATASILHGVNPGLVSHFLKQALVNMAHDLDIVTDIPDTRESWAQLAMKLNAKVIHVAERDSQIGGIPKKPGEFVNTWSIHGLVGEGTDAAELGWGSHERELPSDARTHEIGSQCAIYLERPGITVQVRSWTPRTGAYLGYLITHAESITIPDYFTVRDESGEVVYRPTCHYAYHPCNDTVVSIHEFCGKGYYLQNSLRILGDEIVSGMDELGVLIGGNDRGAYWYGSQLTIEEARGRAPYNNATTLQTSVGVLGSVVWTLENPNRGLVEPDEMDYKRILEVATPYLGTMVGVWTDWSPLKGRLPLFPENNDESDPWQFKNIRVA